MSKKAPASSRGNLLKNTVMLTVLQLSTYILALVAVPYETRVLGPEAYGILGVASAVMVYFSLVMDFGFLLCATADVADAKDRTSELRRILSSVTAAKLLLAVLSAAFLLILTFVIPAWKSKADLLFLFFLSAALSALLPDYMYRGLEDMTAVTLRTVAIRAFFTAAIFVFLRSPDDIYIIPILNIIGNGVAVLFSYVDLCRRFDVRFARIGIGSVLDAVRRSSVFFFSRIASTAYTSLNTVILDMIAAGGAVTGFYTSADKLITTGKNLLSPISDSLYPYMTRNRDYKLVKRILLISTPAIFAFCAVFFIWAEPLCRLILGAEYGPAGNVLRAMLPVGVITLPSYILGFPTLTAMGLRKYANYSVIFGSILHVVNLFILFITDNVSMISLAALVSVAELSILLFRVAVIIKHRHKLAVKETDTDE